MGYDRQKAIDIALAEVGYLEKASNRDLDSKTVNAGSANYTKYARDIDDIPNWFNGKKQAQPWCATFVNWCFVKAYGVEAAKQLLCQPMKSLAASCKYAIQYYQKEGRYSKEPQLGAQIFFSWGHTGLVVALDATTITTIEGNSMSGGKEGVFQKQYKRSYPNILGYGCPNYADGETGGNGSTDVGNSCTVTLPVILNGSQSEWVCSAQILLEARGYSCGRYGCDGEFGPDTEKALREFQADYSVSEGGMCGAATWTTLLGAGN